MWILLFSFNLFADSGAHCLPSPGHCIVEVCKRLRYGECKDENREKVIAACKGNYNGECVKNICNRTGTLSCRKLDQVLAVTEACRGNQDTYCLQYLCSQMGSTYCQRIQNAIKIAKDCGGQSTFR